MVHIPIHWGWKENRYIAQISWFIWWFRYRLHVKALRPAGALSGDSFLTRLRPSPSRWIFFLPGSKLRPTDKQSDSISSSAPEETWEATPQLLLPARTAFLTQLQYAVSTRATVVGAGPDNVPVGASCRGPTLGALTRWRYRGNCFFSAATRVTEVRRILVGAGSYMFISVVIRLYTVSF